MDLVCNFTVNEWGGFLMGEGEIFRDSIEDVKSFKPDFLIKTEKKGETYETTFFPNPLKKHDLTDCDEDWVKMYSMAQTYTTSYAKMMDYLKNGNLGGFVLSDDAEEINDFDYYYAGCFGNNIAIECEPVKHPLYKEMCEVFKLSN